MDSTVTFSALRKDAKEGERILGRMFNGGQRENGAATPADYLITLGAMLNDKKYLPVLEQLRFVGCGSEQHIYDSRRFLSSNPKHELGYGIKELVTRLASNKVAQLGADGRIYTTLSTQSSFSSLDTTAVEWLTLVLFKLFPSEDWKNEIPIFGAE